MACDAPLSIKYDPPLPDGKGGFIYYFPADCGKCYKCLVKRKAQWSFRMTEEQRNSFSSYFVTLTYNDKYLPGGVDGGNSINKNDHNHFIKFLKYYEKQKNLALRADISMEEYKRFQAGIKGDYKLKYYGIAEYGDKKGRCHLHYILFNVRDIGNIVNAWSKQVRHGTQRKPQYKPSEAFGKVQIDECNVNTIDYVLKYMVKFHEDGYNEEKQKECSWMSKGIGMAVANSEFINFIQKIESNQVVNTRGSKIPLPRYYRKKFISEEVRNEKNRYIAHEIQRQLEERDETFRRSGLNPDYVDRANKESRLEHIKNRKKRNHE